MSVARSSHQKPQGTSPPSRIHRRDEVRQSSYDAAYNIRTSRHDIAYRGTDCSARNTCEPDWVWSSWSQSWLSAPSGKSIFRITLCASTKADRAAPSGRSLYSALACARSHTHMRRRAASTPAVYSVVCERFGPPPKGSEQRFGPVSATATGSRLVTTIWPASRGY